MRFISTEIATIRITWLANWLLEMEADLADGVDFKDGVGFRDGVVFKD